MKIIKIISMLLIICLAFAGCAAEIPREPDAPLQIAALRGATAMGMVELIANADPEEYSFAISTTDELIPRLARGEVDIAAIPANLAAVIHRNTQGAYRVAAINTLGVLYTVERGDTIRSAADLRGRTVYAIGKSAIPEFTVSFVLAANGIDPVTGLSLEYKSEAAEVIPLLAQNPGSIAVLQQPFVTVALERIPDLRIAMDWTHEWELVSGGGSTLITGVLIARTELLEQNPRAVRDFLNAYQLSTRFVNENPSQAAVWIEEHGIVSAQIAEKAIPACNITYIDGGEMKRILSGFLAVLYEQDPQSVGGGLPGDDFYWLGD
ncbi:MAG: ABC transporter substrate-binding protein [Oscillospiraceae bacterium]|nr:ABC transporter substrate-binding protein [Oscillospiraceae bacterium]